MTRIPLSRSYLHTPWPIAVFNVMSKPGGAGCNLACEYCFYRHNEGRSQESEDRSQKKENQHTISDELLERFIGEYIASQDNPTVFFTWQGGEPTLVGLDFYRKVVALQQKHARAGVKIANAFQTNGYLLDEQWCSFLAENQFAVGISIDGPQDIHDTYRLTRASAPTYARVRQAIDLLHKHQVRFDTLSTITPANVNRVEELYTFLTRELAASVVQFQPCVERKDHCTVAPGYWPADTLLPVGHPRTMPGTPDSLLTEWAISAQDWGRFLCQFFDLWWERGRGRDREEVVVSWFDSWASQFAGGTAMQCVCSPICGRALSMEKDGSVYSCDHFVYPEYRLGRAGEEGKSLSDLVRCQKQKDFGEAKSRSLPG